ncbi:unnamed protein product [Hymenolepis diminuta]|uniref:Uncharacterized protein n=1 Tax=Hymenolepis diminuta TaxID=6216 RepID=A0A564YLF0_HYMDI|nr:unnamed protein product [Hymenolepis diminuta]
MKEKERQGLCRPGCIEVSSVQSLKGILGTGGLDNERCAWRAGVHPVSSVCVLEAIYNQHFGTG